MSAVTRQMPTVTSHAMRFSWDTSAYCRGCAMMSSLTPDVALAYVRELSADFRAGDRARRARRAPRRRARRWQPPRRTSSTRAPHARRLHGIGRTRVAGVRDPERRTRDRGGHDGRHALPRVVRQDMRTVLAGNGGESGKKSRLGLDSGLVDARLRQQSRRFSAVERGFSVRFWPSDCRKLRVFPLSCADPVRSHC